MCQHPSKITMTRVTLKSVILLTYKTHIKELNIVINGTKIDQVESFNFLGITIDETLSWAQHLNIVRKNLKSNRYFLSIKKYISSGDHEDSVQIFNCI